MIVDLGCGTVRTPGVIGVDRNPEVGPDVVHDLAKFPYPFAMGSVDEIRLDNVLEHLSDVIGTLEEVHRITKPGGTVTIDVPYFRSPFAAIDPTHVHQFTVASFAYFDPNHPYSTQYPYTKARFWVESVTFDERLPGGFLRRVIRRFANAHPAAYEKHLSHLYPLGELRFRLRVPT